MRHQTPLLVLISALAVTTKAFAQDTDPEGGDSAGESSGPSGTETICDDRQDNDGDSVADCGDADCFEFPACQTGGSDERTNAHCSDWVDNDGDGKIDCDDQECNDPNISVCKGSADKGGRSGGSAAAEPISDDLPELQEGMTVDNLIGAYGDKDGERSDELCSDGIDNDQDGRTDCQDFGCRFDTTVSICAPSPEFRLSVVVSGGPKLDMSDMDNVAGDAAIRRVQVRALGPIPYIDNSFFLMSMRLERSPRLTFATFQVPITDSGHYFQVNSGSGNLSPRAIISIGKQSLLDAPTYFRPFEPGNGFVTEIGGPITDNGKLRFRTFAGAGSGVSNGNVGGRFFRSDDRNFNWVAGAQLNTNLIGNYDRLDSLYLYTPVPTTLGIDVGAKYDQRARERFPAAHTIAHFRTGPVLLQGEAYGKYLYDYESFHAAWNVTAGFLAVEKLIYLAADVGGFYASDFKKLPVDGFDADLPRPLDELQIRGAVHFYIWRNVGILTLLYNQHIYEDDKDATTLDTERELRLEAQFRF